MKTNRGYTLVELLIGATIGLFIMSVAVGMFFSQQAALLSTEAARNTQDVSRDAMMELEPSLRNIGFGLDPRFAFDFQNYSCSTPPCRDSASGPDEIVFVARNPYYQWNDFGVSGCVTSGGCFVGNAWPITAANALSITITANPGDQFLQGRVLQAVCPGGSLSTMMTVASTTPSTPLTAIGSVVISLASAVTGNPYKENNLLQSCFTQPGAGLFLVERRHYKIQNYNGTPYLMLDTGLDLNLNGVTPDQGDANDLIPIAAGVEDMQIAYLFSPGALYGFTAPDADGNWITGDTAGTVEEPDPTTTAPLYSTPLNDPSRFNLNPANIRGLRVTLSLRPLTPDHSQAANWLGDPLQLSENRNAQLTNFGMYRRYVTSTSVVLRNMDARSLALF